MDWERASRQPFFSVLIIKPIDQLFISPRSYSHQICIAYAPFIQRDPVDEPIFDLINFPCCECELDHFTHQSDQEQHVVVILLVLEPVLQHDRRNVCT